MKYQMTRKGMESLYLLAWRQGAERELEPDAIRGLSERRGDEFEEVPDELMLEELHAAGEAEVPVEAAARAEQYARHEVDRRDAHLLWLGYAGV